MSEEKAFVRAIVDNPTDAFARLVYADWLEEHGDSRAEYLRLLLRLAGSTNGDQRADEHRKRLWELEKEIDLRWLALMNRGRSRARIEGVARYLPTRQPQRSRREAEIGIFLQQYARKAPKRGEPNDRHYSREVEKLVKRMKPEELDRLMRGEDC
jgi:uncharacterized protein (TIGR02996 family)